MSLSIDQWIPQIHTQHLFDLPKIEYVTLHAVTLFPKSDIHSSALPPMLHLQYAYQIPQDMMTTIAKIPSGKGMAGMAYQHMIPIMSCDLKQQPHPSQAHSVQQLTAYQAIAYPILDPSYQFDYTALNTLGSWEYMLGEQTLDLWEENPTEEYIKHKKHHRCCAVLGIAFKETVSLDDKFWSYFHNQAQSLRVL